MISKRLLDVPLVIKKVSHSSHLSLRQLTDGTVRIIRCNFCLSPNAPAPGFERQTFEGVKLLRVKKPRR